MLMKKCRHAKYRESRHRQRQSGLQKTDKWGAGGDNVDYDTGQVTTPGLATLLLTSPQKYRNTHET